MTPRPAADLSLARATVPFFARKLARHGSAPALVTDDAVVTYRELASRVAERATLMGAERRLVLIAARNDLETVVDYLAALSTGHVALLAYADDETVISSLLQTYKPDLLCVSGDLTERTARAVHKLNDDLALLLSTSGTTGSAKLVRLSHDNVQSNAEAIVSALQIRSSDRAITSLPLSYCYGLSVLNSHLQQGACVVLSDSSVIDASFWDQVRHHRVTTLAGVPHTFDLLDRVGFSRMDLPNLRYVTQAGGRMPGTQVQRYAELGQQRGFDLVVMYGQTEATARMSTLSPDLAASHPHSIGRPIPGGAFSIEPPPDTSDPVCGELVYTGPNVMLGYAQSPEDLALGRTTTGLRTGDLARRTEDGTYEIVGRLSRVAKVFGLRIDLDRLEQTLQSESMSVCCVSDDVRLLIAVASRHSVEQVGQRAAELCNIPSTSVQVLNVDAMPRKSSGKVDTEATRALFSDLLNEVKPSGPRRNVRDTYAHLLGRPQATPTDTFVSLGGDSLSYIEMTVHLEQIVGDLPADWATMTIEELEHRSNPQRNRIAKVDTSVVLRAAAIMCIVGTHAGVFAVLGGAHLLLAVAGFSFARFVLPQATRSDRLRQIARAVGFIAVPTIAVAAIANVFTGMYSWTTPLLLNWTTNVDHWTVDRQFWFIEVLIGSLLASAALLAVPAIDRWERRHSFAVPMLLVALGTSWQLGLTYLDQLPPNRFGTLHFVFWLFALGWAIERSQKASQRIIVSLVGVVGLAGYFDNPYRDAFVLGGLALLIWTTQLPVPRILSRPVSLVAASSLYIYLVHWQIYPRVSDVSPMLAFTLCISLGVVAWVTIAALQRRLAVMRHQRRVGLTTRSQTRPALSGGSRQVAEGRKG